MDKKNEFEREFSENLDKMLSEGRIEADSSQTEQYRTALDFSSKLIELRSTPRPAFEAKLQARLLSKLNQTEPKVSSGSVWEGLQTLLRSPVWRAVTPIVLVVALVVGVLWGAGIIPREGPTPIPVGPTPIPVGPTPAPQKPPLEVSAVTNKSAYLIGEEVRVELSFKNVNSSSVQIQPFPPLVGIVRPVTYEPVRSFAAGAEGRSVNAGEVTSYVITWDQRDNRGQQVIYGYYWIDLGDIQVGAWHMKPSFGMTAPILILPAEGAIEKTIEVNKSQTVGDITITLERVELSASGMKVYVFNTPPSYGTQAPSPGGPPLPPPRMMISAFAEYSVDGSVVKQAGPSAIRFLDRGMEHVWENLDPVPQNAKELTFRITKLGDWQGPWEFGIPLQ